MVNSNRTLARCIRCESMTRSYIGERNLHGWVMCKHCSKAADGKALKKLNELAKKLGF
jgi:hypothetical protein